MKNSVDYSLPSDYDRRQSDKARRQAKCPHTLWSTRCGICTAVLASDHHILHHTPRYPKLDKRVAVLPIYDETITSIDALMIFELDALSYKYDELTILVQSPSIKAIISALRSPTRVSTLSLNQELQWMEEYRKHDVLETTIISDTLHRLENDSIASAFTNVRNIAREPYDIL